MSFISLTERILFFFMETKYTDKAREVLKQARKTAQTLQLNYVGTEHILISLVKTQQCVASRILQDNGSAKKDS